MSERPLDLRLCVKVAPYDDERWVVTEPYRYVTRSVRPGMEIIVPAGFITDGASVPRYYWRVIPPFGRHFNAAVVHDYLYSRALRIVLTRDDCDTIFLEIMQRDGVPKGRQWAMLRAVRRFGARAWEAGKEAAQAELPEDASVLAGTAHPDEVIELLSKPITTPREAVSDKASAGPGCTRESLAAMGEEVQS